MQTGGAPLTARVYALLAAGGFHSGADVARRLGVSRNAVWKAVEALRALGLEIHAVRNRGYRLPVPCEPLDANAIRGGLAPDALRRVRHVETVWSIESTNAALLARTDPPAGLADVLAAEYQSAGRGRLGRAWLAPPGGAVCLSLGWRFPQLPRDLGALGLAVGVCALRALRGCIAEQAQAEGTAEARGGLALKWPNDLVIGDRKLGGILIEMRAESTGPTYVVIGIGVNVSLGRSLAERVQATGTMPADLASVGVDPGRRNVLVASLIREIIAGLCLFQQEGLQPFAEEWRAADTLRGRAVTATTGESTLEGIARGIDSSGALCVETPRGLQRLISGDVSVRAARGAPNS